MSAWDEAIEEAEAMKWEIEERLERLHECRVIFELNQRNGRNPSRNIIPPRQDSIVADPEDFENV